MSAEKSRIDQILERHGTAITLYSRREFDGAPTATVEAGGSLPAGTYYYRVCPIVEGEEKAVNRESRVEVAADGAKVSLDWAAVAGASSYRAYRSQDPTFPSPSLLAETSGTSLVDDGTLSLQAGNPPESYGSPYVYYVSSEIKALLLSGRIGEEATAKGIVLVEKRPALLSGDCGAKEQDRARVGGVDYEVIGVQPYFLRGVAVYKRAILARMIQE